MSQGKIRHWSRGQLLPSSRCIFFHLLPDVGTAEEEAEEGRPRGPDGVTEELMLKIEVIFTRKPKPAERQYDE